VSSKKISTDKEIVYEPKLEHIDVEITKRCNLACIHCSAQSNSIGRDLSSTEIAAVLNKASTLGLKYVGVTGGEPLVRRRKLMTVLRSCRRISNLKVHLHTNGTLLTSKDASLLAGLVDEITITFLGSKPETHDGVTLVKGSLRATEEGLRRLMDERANVTIFVVPMKLNLKEVPQIVKKVKDIGCSRIRILSLSPTGRAVSDFANLSLDSKDKEWLIEKLIQTQKELDINIEAGFCTRQDYPRLDRLLGHSSCLAAENRVHIDAFGEVFPCTAASGWPELSAGNLRDHNLNLSNIWRLSSVFRSLRSFRSKPPLKCRSCALYPQCMGGCRVIMYYKYRNINLARPDCKPQSMFPDPLS